MTYFYPAVFTCDDQEKKYNAVFPDFTGCQCSASTMEEALRKARETLGNSLFELEEKGLAAPRPSDERLLQRDNRSSHVCVMVVDMDSYRDYRQYKIDLAAAQAAAWSEEMKRKRGGILARVFGLR